MLIKSSKFIFFFFLNMVIIILIFIISIIIILILINSFSYFLFLYIFKLIYLEITLKSVVDTLTGAMWKSMIIHHLIAFVIFGVLASPFCSAFILAWSWPLKIIKCYMTLRFFHINKTFLGSQILDFGVLLVFVICINIHLGEGHDIIWDGGIGTHIRECTFLCLSIVWFMLFDEISRFGFVVVKLFLWIEGKWIFESDIVGSWT